MIKIVSQCLVLSILLLPLQMAESNRIIKDFTLSHVSVTKNLQLSGTREPNYRINVKLAGVQLPTQGVYRDQTRRVITYIINQDTVTISRAHRTNGALSGIATAGSLVSGPSLMFWFPSIQELLFSLGLARVTNNSIVSSADLTDGGAGSEPLNFWKIEPTSRDVGGQSGPGSLVLNPDYRESDGSKPQAPIKHFYPTVEGKQHHLLVFGEKSSTGEAEDNSQVGPFQLFGLRLSSRASQAEWGRRLCEMILMSRPFSTYKLDKAGTYLVTFPKVRLANGQVADCLNQALLREGAAKCEGQVPKLYRDLENEAKGEKLGMWAKTN